MSYMELEPQYWWAIIGILLIIIEIFSPSFFAASLAIGAFAASISAFFNGSLEIQLSFFSFFSVLSVFFVRPLGKKYLYSVKDVKTNADALIGKIGVIKETIAGKNDIGRVAIDGDAWQCKSLDGERIEVGEKVVVEKRESIILTVKQII